MQSSVWNACGLSTHWSRHPSGPPPPMHPKKQVMSSMQPGFVTHPRICEQQFVATQSPHGDPSEGHCDGPQKPAMQSPEQHSSGPPQNDPSGLQAPEQTPPVQTLLQH